MLREDDPRERRAERERADDEQLLDEPVAPQQRERGREPGRPEREAGEASRAGAQEPVPGGRGRERHAPERDQPARERLDREHEREHEPGGPARQRADRGRAPAHHALAPAAVPVRIDAGPGSRQAAARPASESTARAHIAST